MNVDQKLKTRRCIVSTIVSACRDSSVEKKKKKKLMNLQTIYIFCFVLFYPNATIVLLFADPVTMTVSAFKKKFTVSACCNSMSKFHCFSI
jgi:hypothetical protein